MSLHQDNSTNSSKERFRLQFQQDWREYLARHASAAQAFAVVWEKTVSSVRLELSEQAELYWELIQWSHGYEIFTSRSQRHPDAPEQQ